MNLIIGISRKIREDLVEDENNILWRKLPSGAFSQDELKIVSILHDGYLRIVKTPLVYTYINHLVDQEKKLLTRLKESDEQTREERTNSSVC